MNGDISSVLFRETANFADLISYREFKLSDKAIFNLFFLISKDLIFKSKIDSQTISKISFIEYFDIPLLISERLFELYTEDFSGRMDASHLANLLSEFMTSDLDSLLKLAFDIFDFDQDGLISYSDLITIWYSCIFYDQRRQNINLTDSKIVCLKEGERTLQVISKKNKSFEKIKKMDFEMFKKYILKENSDLFLILYYYFLKIRNVMMEIAILYPKKDFENKSTKSKFHPNYTKTEPDEEERIDHISIGPFTILEIKERNASPVNKFKFEKNEISSILNLKPISPDNQLSPNISPTAKKSENIINFNKIGFNSVFKKLDKSGVVNSPKDSSTGTPNSPMISIYTEQSKKTRKSPGVIKYLRQITEENQNIISNFNQSINTMSDSMVKVSEEPILNRRKTQDINIVTDYEASEYIPPQKRFKPSLKNFQFNFPKFLNRSTNQSPRTNSNSPTKKNSPYIDMDKENRNLKGYISKFNTSKTEIRRFYFIQDKYKLIYFKNESSKNPSGIINLIRCFIKAENKTKIENKIYYPINIYHSLNKDTLLCETEEDFEKWVTSLKKLTEEEKKYEPVEIIGQGKFSIVHKGVDPDDGKEVAIKILRKTKMEKIDLESTRREVSILQICQHPNIVHMKTFYENYEYIYIIQEYFSNSADLFDYMKKRNFDLKEKEAKYIVNKIVSVIEYLHSLGIIHRDIKPENILISIDKVEKKKSVIEGLENPDTTADIVDIVDIKVIDFGLSRFLGKNQFVFNEPYGTMAYAPPEVILNKEYDKSIDLYSLGVLAYFLLSGSIPFEGKTEDEIRKKVLESKLQFRSSKWKSISSEAKDFIKSLIIKSSEKRISMDKIKKHKWLVC